MTNCAELDGVTNCYRCYAALCGTGATPKRVKHLLDGNPIIVSNAPTAELATPAAREMCETMMETMRTLAGRRTHATQYATSGGRMQVTVGVGPDSCVRCATTITARAVDCVHLQNAHAVACSTPMSAPYATR